MPLDSTTFAGFMGFWRALGFEPSRDSGLRLRHGLSRANSHAAMAKPTFISPMLATRVSKLPEGRDWEYEVKWDGYRILAAKVGSNVRLFSRRGASYTNKFKAVTTAVAGIKAESALLDGEVVATDAKGQPSFQVLQNRGKLPAGHQLIYYVFDLLFLNGRDLTKQPLDERRAALPKQRWMPNIT
jgi:bifunctional non-homologous end joining protein LigD